MSPLIRQYAFLLDKHRVQPVVTLEGADIPVPQPAGTSAAGARAAADGVSRAGLIAHEPQADAIEVPLIRVAWVRSGDKGDSSNIGVIARRPEWLPWLRAQLTPERVRAHLAHLVQGEVTRYEVPGIHAFNFVCTEALGGGGMASLRNDPLGKGMGQILLAMPVRVPAQWGVGAE